MTDRTNFLTVVLDKDYRVDDVEAITNAIKMIKGVMSVDINVSDPSEYFTMERVRRELGEKLWEVLYPKKKDE